jgi:hypothetical protein
MRTGYRNKLLVKILTVSKIWPSKIFSSVKISTGVSKILTYYKLAILRDTRKNYFQSIQPEKKLKQPDSFSNSGHKVVTSLLRSFLYMNKC